jgi:biotin carboxyl carrier protein
MNFLFWLGQREFKVGFEEKGKTLFQAQVGDKTYDVSVEFIGRDALLLNVDGRVFNVVVHSNTVSHSVIVNGRNFRVGKKSAVGALKEDKGRIRKRDVKITMPGRVVRLLAAAGDPVEEGQPVLVLEAMKMQNEIKSPRRGRLSRVHFSAGDYVEAGSILFSVE